MKFRNKWNGWALSLTLALVAYHLMVLTMGAFPRFSELWNREEFQLRIPGQKALKLWLWTTTDSALNVDSFGEFNRRWLGMPLNILNYQMGLTPPWMFQGATQPKAWYFWDLDLPSQSPEMIERVYRKYQPGQHLHPNQFRTQKMEWITVPVPTKSAVERQFLPPGWAEKTSSGVDVYRQILSADPQGTVDLLGAYAEYKKEHPDALLYRPLDIHWTSLGMAIAAKETVRTLAELGWEVRVPELRKVRTIPKAHTQMDLFFLRRLFLPDFFVQSRSELEWTEEVYDIDMEAEPVHERLILFGSSFSLDPAAGKEFQFGFGNRLARALGRELILFAYPGQDFVDAMRKAAESGFTFRPGDLVVVEYPLWQVEWVWKKSRLFPGFN